MSPTEQTWEELLKRLEAALKRRSQAVDPIAEDNAAWADLLERLKTLARIILGSRGTPFYLDPEDLAAEVLQKFLSAETLRRVRLSGSPSGYVFTMIRHAAIDARRAERSEQEAIRQLGREVHAAAADSPGAGDDNEEHAEALRRELKQLPHEDLGLLVLRFGREMSIADIAELRGLNYSTVAKRLFRIVQHLRERLRASSE